MSHSERMLQKTFHGYLCYITFITHKSRHNLIVKFDRATHLSLTMRL